MLCTRCSLGKRIFTKKFSHLYRIAAEKFKFPIHYLDLVGLMACRISSYFHTSFSPISSPCWWALILQSQFSNPAGHSFTHENEKKPVTPPNRPGLDRQTDISQNRMALLISISISIHYKTRFTRTTVAQLSYW